MMKDGKTRGVKRSAKAWARTTPKTKRATAIRKTNPDRRNPRPA